MQILFHLMADTGCLPDKVVPQIPTNRMKGEDQETPRICTGYTLDDCLTGIGIPHFISSFLLSEIRQGRSAKHAAETMLLPFVGRVYCVAAKLIDGGRDALREKTEWVLHSIACRAAIKAGDHTNAAEMLALAQHIMDGTVPPFCPHGRPCVLKITRKELEKQFGRLV